MNERPLVSVIIPTYNRSSLIGETLDSIIAQTYHQWECIVVDDGSTDYTNELLEFYTQKDARIQFYPRPGSLKKGANACRNYGFELSKGNYINWFDSDDFMMANKLEEQVRVLKANQNLSFCTCEYGLYDENLKLISLMNFNPNSNSLLEDYIIGKAYINLQTSLFRKYTLSLKFNEDLHKAQEMEFFFRYLQMKKIKYQLVKKELLKVRLHDQNITSDFKFGNNDAIISEMKVRLLGLKILKKISSKENFIIATNNYLKFLILIIKQKKIRLYNYFLFSLLSLIPISKYSKILKLFAVGLLYNWTNKGLYRFRYDFLFDSLSNRRK